MKLSCFVCTIFAIGISMSSLAGQENPKVYVRVTLLKSSPADVPVQAGLSVFDTFREFPWRTFGKFGIGRTTGKMVFSHEFDALLPWEKLGNADQFRPGDTSPWVEISQAVYAVNPEKNGRITPSRTFAFTFNTPARPPLKGKAPLPRPMRMGFKGDCGNIDGISARIDFADAPSDSRILKSISYDSDISVIGIVADGVSDGNSAPLPLVKWAASIQTIYDAVCRQLKELQKRGVKKEKICERFVTDAWIHHGYHFNLYDTKTALKQAEWSRMMGFNFCNWYITTPPGINNGTMPHGVSCYVWHCSGGPEWVSDNPWASGFMQKVADGIAPYIDDWKKEIDYKLGSRILCKVGDEVKLIKKETILETPASHEAFRKWLASHGIAPSELGYKDYKEIKPIFRESVKDSLTARQYYYTCMFRQDATADWWKEYVSVLRQKFGVPVEIGTESCGVSYDEWPDYFLWSRMGFMNFMIHEYTTKLWVPPHYAIAIADKHRCVAKFGREKCGGLLAPGRVATQVGVELTGTTALMRGMQILHHYDYYYDNPQLWDIQASVAKILHRAARIEDYILDGKSSINDAQCAVLHSPVWELWRGDAGYSSVPYLTGGWLAEKNMLVASLAFQQIPYDFLPTEEVNRLANYKVLYVTDPNVPQKTQLAIVDWVRAGGVLFMVADAAVRNEFNEPAKLIDVISGRRNATSTLSKKTLAWGEYTDTLYKFKPLDYVEWKDGGKKLEFEAVARKERIDIPRSKILATYKDGTPAAVRFNAGKGSVVYVGTSLAAALARTASESFLNDVVYLRQPEKQFDQRHFDTALMKLYAYPVKQAGIKCKLTVSKIGVDATFYETQKGAVVFLADYDSGDMKKVTVDAEFDFDYKTCITEAGHVLPVIKKDGRTIIKNVELRTSEVLFLK